MTSNARRALLLIYPPSFALDTTITGALAAVVSYPVALRRLITRFSPPRAKCRH